MSDGGLLNTLDLTFAQPGDRFGTRAGWTAIIVAFEWPAVRGKHVTDYGTFPMRWRLDGRAEHQSDDIVEKLK